MEKHAEWRRIYERWQNGEEPLTYQEARIIYREFDMMMNAELSEIKRQTNSADPDKALGSMMLLTSFINVAAALVPAIFVQVQKWIGAIKSRVDQIARTLLAKEYSIGVTAPGFALTITITWDVSSPSSGTTP
jgi:hypothetical protein